MNLIVWAAAGGTVFAGLYVFVEKFISNRK